MKWHFLYYIIFIVIGYILVFRVFPYFNHRNYGCDLHKKIYLQKVNFKLERKFIDTSNHNNPTLIYTTDGNIQDKMVLDVEFEDMFDDLNVGDSVIKVDGSLLYKVKSNQTGQIRLFKFHTLCKDSINTNKVVRLHVRMK